VTTARAAAALEIRLIGPLAASVRGRAVPPPASRRAWALLGFLALRPGPLSRAEIAAALWPEVRDTAARGSLRSAVWALRRALGSAGSDRLEATRDTLGLVDDAALWTDLRAFATAVADGQLEAALTLRRGPLLDGIEDDWALLERDAFEDRFGAALGTLTLDALEDGDRALAIRWARRRADLAPCDEPAARALMVALAAAGEKAAALTAYERLTARLRRQLDVDPAPATRGLAARIRAGGSAAEAGPPPQALLRWLRRDDALVATAAPRARG
jgi:DNA-binding SARP family transcriptional activator